MPVLANKQHLVGIAERQHGHGARVLDDVAIGPLPVGHLHGIPPDRDDAAGSEHLGGHRGPVLHGIRQPGAAIGGTRSVAAHALAIERAAAAAEATDAAADFDLDRSSAAAITPWNNGCGLVGRDRNSGCAWVATKNGCSDSGISTNSTSRPSGESPEQISPAASSVAR